MPPGMPPAPVHARVFDMGRPGLTCWASFVLVCFQSMPVQAAWPLRSLVISEYEQLDDLAGWQNTRRVIAATLGAEGRTDENTAALIHPEQAGRFFAGLPPSGPLVLYLAAHQSPQGLWEFSRGEKLAFSELIGQSPLRKGKGESIVLLDVCHAGAVARDPAWKRWGPGALVTTSDAAEKTWELRLFNRRPMDFETRFPREMAWLRRELGPRWDGRLSYFGFVWLQVFLDSSSVPDSLSAWEDWVRRMQQQGRALEPRRAPDFRSILTWNPFSD